MVVAVFDRAPSAMEAKGMAKASSAVVKAHKKVDFLTVVGADCKLPESDIRDQLTRDVKVVQTHIGVVATVIEGAGFGAAALRGAVTGMTLMLRPNYPTKVFATVSGAAEFIAAANGLGALEVTVAVNRLRLRAQ